jgi:phage shock protein PspC (stress-responsive transcriptional regulator)
VTDRLYRHPTDRAIAGVAAGIAAWLNIDPSLVRIAWVLLAIFSGGIFVLVYFVMMIVVPLAPPGWTPRGRGTGAYPPYPGPDGAPGGWGAAAAPPPPDWTGAPGAPEPAAGPTGWPDASAAPGGWPAAGPSPSPAPAWAPPKGVNAGNAGIVAGVVLVVLGIWFLVDQFVEIDWDLLWPVIIMVLGGTLIAGALLRSRAS